MTTSAEHHYAASLKYEAIAIVLRQLLDELRQSGVTDKTVIATVRRYRNSANELNREHAEQYRAAYLDSIPSLSVPWSK